MDSGGEREGREGEGHEGTGVREGGFGCTEGKERTWEGHGLQRKWKAYGEGWRSVRNGG